MNTAGVWAAHNIVCSRSETARTQRLLTVRRCCRVFTWNLLHPTDSTRGSRVLRTLGYHLYTARFVTTSKSAITTGTKMIPKSSITATTQASQTQGSRNIAFKQGLCNPSLCKLSHVVPAARFCCYGEAGCTAALLVDQTSGPSGGHMRW